MDETPNPQDLILCRLHMRRYDGTQVSGCPVCMGTEADTTAESKSGAIKWVWPPSLLA